MTFFGALVQAGSGAFTYHQIADRLSYVVGLILSLGEEGDDASIHRQATGWCSTPMTTTSTKTRIRTTSGFVTRRRCTATTSSASGPCRGMPMCWQGFRNSTTLSNKDGVSLDPVCLAQPRTRQRPCRSWPWTIRTTCGCARLVSKGFTPSAGFASWSPGSPRSRCSISTCMLEKVRTLRFDGRLRRRIRRQAADGRHLELMGVPVARPRPDPGPGPTA